MSSTWPLLYHFTHKHRKTIDYYPAVFAGVAASRVLLSFIYSAGLLVVLVISFVVMCRKHKYMQIIKHYMLQL